MIPLISLLLQQLIVPEVVNAIKAHQATNAGQFPTTEQIIEIMNANADAIIARSKAWQAVHPAP